MNYRKMIITLIVASFTISPVWAHGDEPHDHGPEEQTTRAVTGKSRHIAKESQFLLGLRTAVVKRQPLVKTWTFTGLVTLPPEARASLAAPIEGTLQVSGRWPQVGQTITRGQTLAVIQPIVGAVERSQAQSTVSQLEADRQRLQGELSLIRSDVAIARENWERLKKLEPVIARKDLRAAEATYQSSQAREKATNATLRAIATQQNVQRAIASGQTLGNNRYPVQSPISGVISQVNAQSGATVSARESLFEVIDRRQLWIEAQVFESDLPKLAGVQQLSLKGNKTYTVKRLPVPPVIDPNSRYAKILYRVDQAGDDLAIGQFATLSLPISGGGEMLTVPRQSLYELDGKQWVFVRTGPETFERREVKVEGETKDLIGISGSIQAGDRVVTQGGYQLLNMK